MPHIHYVQHVPFEGLGRFADWLDQRGITHQRWNAYEGKLPAIDDIGQDDALIVMGGPMGVGDTALFPWLVAEIELIRGSIAAGKKVLGVCLGAQLIAVALGAPVTRHTGREIGWFPITPDGLLADLPHPQAILHWHGDTFALPKGAASIGQSDYCANQGFSYNDGRVLALQFHVELDAVASQALGEACADELHSGQSHVQPLVDIVSRAQHFVQADENVGFILETFL